MSYKIEIIGLGYVALPLAVGLDIGEVKNSA
jgi:UDP-N-acetyl-D-mannosaminuronate dehydrogenase